MTSNVDLTNRALATIGTRSQITSMTDGSTEALYANLLYNGLRDFMLREGDYDWSMGDSPATGVSPGPALPWLYTYQYPFNAIRIRQMIGDPPQALLDPHPTEWNVVWLNNARVIVTKNQMSAVIYTFAPVEDVWDSIFTESFIRLLGSSLAFALENRIEASSVKLNEALSFANIANMRDA